MPLTMKELDERLQAIEDQWLTGVGEGPSKSEVESNLLTAKTGLYFEETCQALDMRIEVLEAMGEAVIENMKTVFTLVSRIVALEGFVETWTKANIKVGVTVSELVERVVSLEIQNGGFVDILELEDLVPEWVLPLIEALNGVRLGGAHAFAVSLQGKYYPTNEVEGKEVLPNG